MKVPAERTEVIDAFKAKEFESQVQPTDTSVLQLPKKPQKKIDLTLEQCRALAMENNLDLKVQLLDPTISQETVNAELAKFESAFVANLNHLRFDQPNVSKVNLDGNQGNNTDIGLGVNMPLKTGGTIKFDLADNRSFSNSTNLVINPVFTNDMSISISQPLLRDAYLPAVAEMGSGK